MKKTPRKLLKKNVLYGHETPLYPYIIGGSMRFNPEQKLILLPKLKVIRYTKAGWVLCEVCGRVISIPESYLVTDKFFELRPKKITFFDKLREKFKYKGV